MLKNRSWIPIHTVHLVHSIDFVDILDVDVLSTSFESV